MTHPRLNWLVMFVLGSAVVGPVMLAPPWGDDYRRQQQVGFLIGVMFWSSLAGLAISK